MEYGNVAEPAYPFRMPDKFAEVDIVDNPAETITATSHQYGFHFGMVQKSLQVIEPAFIRIREIKMAAAYRCAYDNTIAPCFQGLFCKNDPFGWQVAGRTGNSNGIAGFQVRRELHERE